jgi:hypothetical protein
MSGTSGIETEGNGMKLEENQREAGEERIYVGSWCNDAKVMTRSLETFFLYLFLSFLEPFVSQTVRRHLNWW